MYLVFTRMPGKGYRRRRRSLLLYLCYVFRALINSLVCWYCTSALGLVLFQICAKSDQLREWLSMRCSTGCVRAGSENSGLLSLSWKPASTVVFFHFHGNQRVLWSSFTFMVTSEYCGLLTLLWKPTSTVVFFHFPGNQRVLWSSFTFMETSEYCGLLSLSLKPASTVVFFHFPGNQRVLQSSFTFMVTSEYCGLLSLSGKPASSWAAWSTFRRGVRATLTWKAYRSKGRSTPSETWFHCTVMPMTDVVSVALVNLTNRSFFVVVVVVVCLFVFCFCLFISFLFFCCCCCCFAFFFVLFFVVVFCVFCCCFFWLAILN